MKKLLIGALIAALLLSGCQGLFPTVPVSGESAPAVPPEVTRQATVPPTAAHPSTPPSTATPADPAVRSAIKLKDLIDRFNAMEISHWRGYWEEKCQYSKDSPDETNAAMLEMTLEDYQILKAYVLPRIAEYEASQGSTPPTETEPPATTEETAPPSTESQADDPPPPTATEPPTAATEPPTAATDPPTEPPTEPVPNPSGGGFLDGSGMLSSINSARQSAGLSAYAWDSSLASVAQTRAMELAQLFSHDRPGGGRVTDQYYECIYYGSGYLGDLGYAFDYWWDSPVHHAIIMQAEGDRCYVAGYQSGEYTYWVLLVRPYWN